MKSPRCSSLSPPRAATNLQNVGDLPPCLRIFHARRKRGIMSASKRESSKGVYSLPPAFQSCLEGRAEKQAILQQVVTTTNCTSQESSNEKDNHNHNHNNTTTLQRIRKNLSRKRATWQQKALRGRHEAHQHELTLKLLKEAVKYAKVPQDNTSSTETSEELVDVETLLEHIREKRLPLPAEKSSSSCCSTNGILLGKNHSRNAAATKIQAQYRGHVLRQSLTVHSFLIATDTTEQHSLTHSLPSWDSRPIKLDRQSSDITMSDFGDSTHQTLRGLSSHKTCRSIEEEEEDDGEERYEADSISASMVSDVANKTSCSDDDTGSFDILTAQDDSVRKSSVQQDHEDKDLLAKHVKLGDTRLQGQRPSWTCSTTKNGNIRIDTAMAHSSLTSFFAEHENVALAPFDRSPVILARQRDSSPRATALCPTCHNVSGCQCWNDTKSLDDDDDVSLTGSFFEEEVKFEKDPIRMLHRSEGSLDFFRQHRESAKSQYIKGKTIPPSCFHLSFGSSTSLASRWDDGYIGQPSSGCHPKPPSISKGATATYLPVRPPARKCSTIVVPFGHEGSNNNNNKNDDEGNNNNSMSSIFSSKESIDPSPQMPLRKASSHGTAHHHSFEWDRNSNSKSSILPPSTPSVGPRMLGSFTESSPQLPIRKGSTHTSTRSNTEEDTLSTLSSLHSPWGPNHDSIKETDSRNAEDRPIRQPERKVSSISTNPTSNCDRTTDRPTTTTCTVSSDDSPVCVPVRKLSALTLNSAHSTSSIKMDTKMRDDDVSPQIPESSTLPIVKGSEKQLIGEPQVQAGFRDPNAEMTSETNTTSPETSTSPDNKSTNISQHFNGPPRSPVVEQLVATRAEMAKQRRMQFLLEQSKGHLLTNNSCQ